MVNKLQSIQKLQDVQKVQTLHSLKSPFDYYLFPIVHYQLIISYWLLPIALCQCKILIDQKNISISSQFSYEFDSIELHSCFLSSSPMDWTVSSWARAPSGPIHWITLKRMLLVTKTNCYAIKPLWFVVNINRHSSFSFQSKFTEK